MPSTQIQPYLFFGGNCAEALDFYQGALDARVDMVMRYSDSPEPAPPGMVPEDYENKIMHASFYIGDSMIMASDSCGETDAFAGFSLHLGVASETEARRYFDALAAGGEITMPLGFCRVAIVSATWRKRSWATA